MPAAGLLRPRAVLCVCVTNIRSEHLFVLFLLSPLHPPLSVCQNTNGPLLGPCHLVSIHVTLVTASLLNLCAWSERGSCGPLYPFLYKVGCGAILPSAGQRRLLWFPRWPHACPRLTWRWEARLTDGACLHVGNHTFLLQHG